MVKNISLLFLFLIVFSNASAQIFQNMSFKAGYVSSNVTLSFDNKTMEDFAESKDGIFFSISREFLLSDLFSLKPYLAYYQKGFDEKFFERNEKATVIKKILAKTKLDYLSLIFTGTIKYDNPVITPYISVGPRLDFLVNKEKGIINFTTITTKSLWADFISKWSYGAAFIIGFDYKINDNSSLILEGSYNPDFSDLLRNSSLNEYIKMKQNTFDIGIGISL